MKQNDTGKQDFWKNKNGPLSWENISKQIYIQVRDKVFWRIWWQVGWQVTEQGLNQVEDETRFYD